MARRYDEAAELRQMLDRLETKYGLAAIPAPPPKRRKPGGATAELGGGGPGGSGARAGAGATEAEDGLAALRSGFYELPEEWRGPRRHRPRTGRATEPGAEAGGGEGEEGRPAGRVEAPERSGSAAALTGRAGRRRVRRWGDAARKAAQREVADGPLEKSGSVRQRSLRAVREAYPLSQQELAERARLARSTIAELESGRRRAYPSTRRAIARVLEVEVGEIAW